MHTKKIILSMNPLDEKFSKLLPENYILKHESFIDTIFEILRQKEPILIIRYISSKKGVILLTKIAVYYFLLKMRCGNIIYSMHNVKHYKNYTKISDSLINNILYFISDKIIYFCDEHLQHIPSKYEKKIIGKIRYLKSDFPTKSDQPKGEILRFQKKILSWIGDEKNIILMVSTVPITEEIAKFLRRFPKIIVINPNTKEKPFVTDNMYYSPKPYYGGFKFLKPFNVIGFCYVDNISVSSSLYNFAYNEMPVISISGTPNETTISKHGIGSCCYLNISDEEHSELVEGLLTNYELYQELCRKFRPEEETNRLNHGVFQRVFGE